MLVQAYLLLKLTYGSVGPETIVGKWSGPVTSGSNTVTEYE
jgi:hypothetical protein